MKITKSQLKKIIKEELDEMASRDPNDPYRNVPHHDLLGLLQAAKLALKDVVRYEGVIPPAMEGHIQDADRALEKAWARGTVRDRFHRRWADKKGEY